MNAYQTAMTLELEDIDEERVRALNNIIVQKKIVAKRYNKKVKPRTFDEGDLVWKTILPIGSKDPKYGKWSPKWEDPFQIHKVFKGGFYHLKNLKGHIHLRKINGRFLEQYFPTIWEGRNLDT